MGLFDFGSILGDILTGPSVVSNPSPSIGNIIKTAQTIDALLTDQTTEGKKEGYSDAASEYEPIYSDLKNEYDKLISDINCKRSNLDVTSEKGLAELEKLEAERDRLKSELHKRAEDASGTFNVSASTLLSSLSAGSSSFFTSSSMWGYDLRDGIIAKKKKERIQARKEGYLEAKALYEEKIAQLKDHYRKTKEDADLKLSVYSEHISKLLNEIEAIRFQIADLKLAMSD